MAKPAGVSRQPSPGQRTAVRRRRSTGEHRKPSGCRILGTTPVNRIRAGQLDRRRRRVMRAQRTRHAWRSGPRRLDMTDDPLELREGNLPGAQQRHLAVPTGDDRGLQTHLAIAAVEHEPNSLAQLVPDVGSAGRTDAAVTIGRGCSDSATETAEHRLGDRMGRDAQCHRVLAATCSDEARWTINGWSGGRSLAAKIRATAAGFEASAPRP
jgi:hypothetical protein